MASTPPPTVRFEFSRVVERTFASIGRNFGVFALLALLLAGLPGMIIGGLFGIAGAAPAGLPTAARLQPPRTLSWAFQRLAWLWAS